MIRTKKITEVYRDITLKQQSDGRLIPFELNGFKFPKDIESQIDTVASWVRSSAPDNDIVGDKYLEKVYFDIEQELEASKGKTEDKISQKTLRAYADAIERGKQKESFSSNSDGELSILVKNATALVRQWRLIMDIASIIAEQQQAFLNSGELMDYNGCTYKGIASKIDCASEATVRRYIHDLRFTIGNQPPIHAADLFVRGNMPRLMALVLRILEGDPNVGAPAVTRKLHEKGEDVSERLVGLVMDKISKPRFKAARRAAAKEKLSSGHAHGSQSA